MMRIDRRKALALSFGASMLPFAATAQSDWYSDRRRRQAYEHWRAEQWRRHEMEARRQHRHWDQRRDWDDERERNTWARQQPWWR